MGAHSGAVVARGVTVMMGAEIAALAAVNGGRLGGGGGLDRPRVALKISDSAHATPHLCVWV